MKKFTKDLSAPGVLPIAVLSTSVESIEVFDTNRVDAYRYELLGGQHTALAYSLGKKDCIAAKSPDNTLLQTVLAEVYVGLTDDEALRLASRHNTNSHFIHKLTHRDYTNYVSYRIQKSAESNVVYQPIASNNKKYYGLRLYRW